MPKLVAGKTVKMMLYFREDQRKALEALAEKTGAPLAELVRRAVDMYVKAQK